MVANVDFEALVRDGCVCMRANDAQIEDVFVFGERSSGSNITQSVFWKTWNLPVNKSYGWKHGPPAFMAASTRTLFIVTVRDPFEWAISMYAKPYHMLKHLKDLTFDEFIRSPWLSEMDAPRAHGLNRRRYLGQVLQPDRHPISGRPYDDIFEMRSVKLRSWFGLAERAVNLVVLKNEALTEDPVPVLDRIAREFALSPMKRDKPDAGYIFESRDSVTERRSHAIERLSDNRQYIQTRLDQEVERALGYLPSD